MSILIINYLQVHNYYFRSKSATYIRDGATAPVHNINDAKKKILDCLGELSNIHTFLNSEERVEIDLENQLQLVGDIKNRDCCNRNFPHLHATLNGIPIILQLNKVGNFRMILT